MKSQRADAAITRTFVRLEGTQMSADKEVHEVFKCKCGYALRCQYSQHKVG